MEYCLSPADPLGPASPVGPGSPLDPGSPGNRTHIYVT